MTRLEENNMILDNQFYDDLKVEEDYSDPHVSLNLEERNLVAAIINLALLDLTRPAFEISAKEYFKGSAFKTHCILLGLSHEKMRNKILEGTT